jgi:hypothetical protein
VSWENFLGTSLMIPAACESARADTVALRNADKVDRNDVKVALPIPWRNNRGALYAAKKADVGCEVVCGIARRKVYDDDEGVLLVLMLPLVVCACEASATYAGGKLKGESTVGRAAPSSAASCGPV